MPHFKGLDMMNLLKDRLVIAIRDKEEEKAEEIKAQINKCTTGIFFLIVFYSKEVTSTQGQRVLLERGYYSREGLI